MPMHVPSPSSPPSPEGSGSAAPAVLAGVEARPDFARVAFGTGSGLRHADFHWFWLRHHCPCCRHPQTGERTLCASRVPLGIEPLEARIGAGGAALELRWPAIAGETQPHASRFDADWLRAHAYAPDHEVAALPEAALAPYEIEAGAGAPRACLARVRERGAAIVRGAGADTEAWIEALCAEGLRVVPTHFGRIEDLRTDNTTNENTDQLGYTDAPVGLHTDQPYLDQPPRLQMLHCMRAAEEGGENTVADGWQVARYLRDTDREAFDLLTQLEVVFHRKQARFERRLQAPLVQLSEGRIERVRASYFTLAPHRMPFEQMEAWYRAHARFVRLLEDPRHHLRFRLEAGDLLLYDNFRMLHARSGFRGARWVRGVYFDPVGPATEFAR